MFEVGKSYRFRVIEAAIDGLGDSESVWEVVGIDGTLLHLRSPDLTDNPFLEFSTPPGEDPKAPERRDMVLNVASVFFHSAEPVAGEEQGISADQGPHIA